MPSYIYIAIFLGEEERLKLLKHFPAKHANVFADHITLVFKPTTEEVLHYKLGEEVTFSVIGYAEDKKGQAVVVDFQGSKNEIPHITLSTADGTKPLYSNDLLKRGYEKVNPFLLKGIIGGWNGTQAVFGEKALVPCSSIFIPSRPQADTIVAIFLLNQFGGKAFPGIADASVKIVSSVPDGKNFESMLAEGSFLLDMGGGDLDHHNKKEKTTSSELVARKLGIHDDPALRKLLSYAHRDDVMGKGIISDDPIDKAFGLSGLITALNKTNPEKPDYVVQVILPLLKAHYEEEYRRTVELPKEIEEIKNRGGFKTSKIRQRGKLLDVVFVQSDNTSMPGYLRSHGGGGFDVVVQRRLSGHVNILTRPLKRVDLRSLALVTRLEEANQRDISLTKDERYLSKEGRISEVSNWYYDPATNSLQNGGSNPKESEPTKIDDFIMEKLVEVGLSEKVWSPVSHLG